MNPRFSPVNAAAALVGSLLAALPSLAGEEAPGKGGFLPPEACRPCHPQHYEEWRGSMHAYSISDPVFFAMNALGQKETGGKLGDFCIRCHGPVGTITGELKPETPGPEQLSDVARAGVSCEVCHRDVRLKPGHPENASLEIRPGGPMIGGIDEPVRNDFHASRGSDLLRRPDFCGSCHNVVNQRGVPVEKPHVEYEAGPYPRRDVVCVDCHMQTYSGRATPDGPIRSRLHRHDFVGVDVAVTPFPRRGFQRTEVEAFLRTAAALTATVPERIEKGQPLDIAVQVKNVGAGHNLPTGPSTERQMWIEVTVTAESGETVFRSGHLDPDGDLMDEHSRRAPGGDPQLALFTDRFLDANGHEVPFMWQAHRLEERTIPALETREARYRVDLAEAPATTRLSVRVRLLFRAFPPHQLVRLGLADLRDRYPVFVMQEVARAVEIVESLRAPGVIRVPEDVATLPEAVTRARSGEEISVGPGRYLLDRPLDFRGKDIVLRSREGPERTAIELEPAPDDPDAASLIRFTHGETPAARVEGFTFRLGRGSRVDGERLGGAVLILESDPLLAGNVFAENTADRGGSVFLRNSFAHLRDNRHLGNRAEKAGGAIAVVGDSGVLMERELLRGNIALEGGALWLEAGNVLLDSRLERNRAFRGGGGFVRVATGSPDAAVRGAALLVDRSVVAAGSAREGGGLFLEGAGPFLLRRCVVAGNLGGGLHLSGARVEAPHMTLVDHRFGPSVRLVDGARIRFTNSILWGNRPSGLAGEIHYSLVDDPAYLGPESSNLEGFPVFRPPAAEWERCQGPEEDCVPVVRESLTPADSRYWRRYLVGSYRPLATAPTVDRGDPAAPPDADGSLPDLGALTAPKARNLFIRGDLDGDSRVSPADLEGLARVLQGGPLPACADAADVDDNGQVDLGDFPRLLSFLLDISPPPPPPFPRCGVDLSPVDRLGCAASLCDLR